jgi:hypothetical protein
MWEMQDGSHRNPSLKQTRIKPDCTSKLRGKSGIGGTRIGYSLGRCPKLVPTHSLSALRYAFSLHRRVNIEESAYLAPAAIYDQFGTSGRSSRLRSSALAHAYLAPAATLDEGHGFSRAVSSHRKWSALATGESLSPSLPGMPTEERSPAMGAPCSPRLAGTSSFSGHPDACPRRFFKTILIRLPA